MEYVWHCLQSDSLNQLINPTPHARLYILMKFIFLVNDFVFTILT